MEIKNNSESGISVFGYYIEGDKFTFTCINQDSNTPQSRFELNFHKEVDDAINLIRNGEKGRAFVPIHAPKRDIANN